MINDIKDLIKDEIDMFEMFEVNYSDSKELAKIFEVLTVPTLIIIKDGSEKYRTSGTLGKKQIESIFKYVKLS